jgi:RNA polymerase sigma-70 factor (ECF subfamily)
MTIQTFKVMNDRDSANPPGNESLDESELVRRVQAGDGAAYETLVREYGGRLLAVARRYLRCEQDAADAVQDAFMSAFQAIASFQSSSKLSTWLQRILINACLMKLRSHSRRPVISMEELLPVFDATGHHIGGVSPWKQAPLQQVLDGELRTAVRQAIDQLPEIYRTVLLLRDIEEIDTDETADMLKVTQAVVKTRLHRARQALRTLLEPMFVGEE